MELKRVLAKDSRTAMETINENYGENTVIVESNKVQGKVEMIVAVDINTEKEAVPKTFLKDNLNKIGVYKALINFHSDVKANISIKIDKTQSK